MVLLLRNEHNSILRLYPMNIDNYLQDFPQYLRGVRDASENTIKDYLHDVRQYLKYFAEKVDPTMETFCIDEYHMRQFSSYLVSLGNSGATRERRLNGLLVFWRYLHKQHKYTAPVSIKECGIRIKKNRNATQSLTSDDYKALMRGVYSELSWID